MGGREFPTGDSDSGGLPLTNDDGTAIDWLGTAVFAMGVIAAEFFDGLARFVATLWNTFLIEPVGDAEVFAQTFLEELLGTPNEFITASFGTTKRWMASHELVSMGLAVVFVLVLAYLASRVIPRG